MASLIRSLRRNGPRDEPGGVVPHTVGNALVLHSEEAISAEAQSLALSVVEDASNDVVVLDLGDGLPIGSWESMANVLPRRRRGIRLVACGRHHNAAAMAGQWLSERLNRTVIAPDGILIRGSAGALFVHSTPGSGWVRFRPGKPPTWDSKRYPTPLWDAAAVDSRASSSTGEIEPLPAGVWIHDTRDLGIIEQHRQRLIADVPCQPETMTVLLGCPGTMPLSLDDVVRFWRELDPESRLRARFVQYGDVRTPEGEAFGQALADVFGAQVICYTGVPVGAPNKFELRTVRTDGEFGWPPYALELGYVPRSHPNSKARRPAVLSYRAPLQWTEQISPRVYWYAPDAVVEIVEAGLWIRSIDEPANAERVRATRLDPDASMLVFDDTVDERAGRMRELADDLAARVDPSVGKDTTLFAASVLVPGQRSAGRAEATLQPHEESRSATEPGAHQTELAGKHPAAGPPQAAGSLPVAPPVPAASIMSAPTAGVVIEPVRAPAIHQRFDLSSFIKPVEQVQAEPKGASAPVTADRAVTPVTPGEPFTTPITVAVPMPVGQLDSVTLTQSELSAAVGSAGSIAPPEVAITMTEPIHVESPTTQPSVDRLRVLDPTPRTTQPQVRVQPIPPSGATALLPSRALDEERSWLRRTLSRDFDIMASSVSRLMSEHPGLQASGTLRPDDVLTDSVAVRLYLSGRGKGIDAGLRSGDNGPHVPFARCAVSGLSRLPSFRGPTVYRITPSTPEWSEYRNRRIVTDWAFVNALTAPCADQRGDTDVLIWSMTARRTAVLEPEGDGRVVDRVLFLPGSHYKILELHEPAGAERGAILLREIGSNEIDDDGRVDPDRVSLDQLAVTSLRRSIERWASAEPQQRVGPESAARFGTLPGLDRGIDPAAGISR